MTGRLPAPRSDGLEHNARAPRARRVDDSVRGPLAATPPKDNRAGQPMRRAPPPMSHPAGPPFISLRQARFDVCLLPGLNLGRLTTPDSYRFAWFRTARAWRCEADYRAPCGMQHSVHPIRSCTELAIIAAGAVFPRRAPGQRVPLSATMQVCRDKRNEPIAVNRS